MAAAYRERLPLLSGAAEVVRALEARWMLGLARAKPAPDVYLEAAADSQWRRGECVAVEDSSDGLRSAAAAGMVVVAVPNAAFPPPPDALALASASVRGVADLTPAVIERAATAGLPGA